LQFIMPKKTSTTPGGKTRTNTSPPKKKKTVRTNRTFVAVTDTDWGKLESTPATSLSTSETIATPRKTTDKFPWESFPFRLDIKKENRVCWFQHEDHLNKLIEREKLTSKDYQISTNGVEIMGKSTGRKRRK